MTRYFKAALAACAALLLIAPLPSTGSPAPDPTPPATTSSDCPNTNADTKHFLTAPSIAVRAPSGMLSLVVVRDGESRARGLMCVVHIPPDKGMLFAFPAPERLQGFWMKDTLLSLDMIFVTSNGIVSTVAPRVPATPAGTPDDRVARRDGPGQYVIELGAGDAARHGIVHGTKLVFPAVNAQQ